MQWVLGQSAPTPPASLYIKLHIGDPGADGTDNPAAEATRQPVTFETIVSPGVPADGSADALTASTVTWTNLAATESISHITIWDAATNGDAWYKTALIAPVQVLAGGFFEIQGANGLVRHN